MDTEIAKVHDMYIILQIYPGLELANCIQNAEVLSSTRSLSGDLWSLYTPDMNANNSSHRTACSATCPDYLANTISDMSCNRGQIQEKTKHSPRSVYTMNTLLGCQLYPERLFQLSFQI